MIARSQRDARLPADTVDTVLWSPIGTGATNAVPCHCLWTRPDALTAATMSITFIKVTASIRTALTRRFEEAATVYAATAFHWRFASSRVAITHRTTTWRACATLTAMSGTPPPSPKTAHTHCELGLPPETSQARRRKTTEPSKTLAATSKDAKRSLAGTLAEPPIPTARPTT